MSENITQQILDKVNKSNASLNTKHNENTNAKFEHYKNIEAELELALENIKIKDELIAIIDNQLLQHANQIKEL